MKIKEKMKLEDLYFGVKLYEMSYSSREERKIVTYNLFDSYRVKRSVASWVVMKPEEKEKHEFLPWCFGDTWGRTEWEFIMCPWPYGENELVSDQGEKVDIYGMYVEPNAGLLRDLVDRVTVSSAKKYLAEDRRRYH